MARSAKKNPRGRPQPTVPVSPTLPGSLAQHLHDIGLGRKKLPTSDAIRHHYIAQFILREFLDPTQPRERIWQLDKDTGTISPQTTEAAASIRRLYQVIDRHGEPSSHLEGFFAMVEQHAADSIVRLRRDFLRLAEGDRANTSLLLALQNQRTPAGHRRVVEQLSTTARMQLAVELADKDRTVRRYLKNHPDESLADAEAWRVKTLEELRDGQLIVEAPKEMAMEAMLLSWLHVAGEIHGLRWKLLRPQDVEFVLGDRPMVMHDPTPKYPFSGNGFLSSPNCYTLMPLGPGLCLRFDQAGKPLEERSASRQVAAINLRSYGWAERFVYGRNRGVLEDLHAHALADPAAVPTPRSDPQVICELADPDDPAVGAEHPPGYPRGLWYTGHDGEPQFMAYQLQYRDDAQTVVIDESFFG